MLRQIIQIDENKCNGCGLCVKACHEGAIDLIDGKAKLTRLNFCDGYGDCLPNCPANAISFIVKDVPAYDEEAVLNAKNKNNKLNNWPIQLKLAPVKADYYVDADTLVAADCTAYVYKNFHEDFMKDKVTLIACPKLDNVDYSEKLSEIISFNKIKSISLIRMEVPCCSKIETAIRKAIDISGKTITAKVTILNKTGNIIKKDIL